MRLLVVAAALFVVSTALLLVNTGGHAIHDGDEAIYAQMAREMASTRRIADLTWQGEVQIVRPPLAVWILALARGLFEDERCVRWPNAAAAGAEVALVFLLAAALFRRRRWLAGALAAGALFTADLFIGYARYFESEPFLCAFILAAALAWERAHRRPRWVYVFGAFVGAALMTKQVIGGLPLAFPVADALSRDKDRIPFRRAARGLVAAAIVWLPWHVWQLVVHGRAFLAAYVGHNVLARAQTGILHTTRWTFYARELWRSEGPFALLMAAGVMLAAVQAVRRRARADLLIAMWAIGPFVVFSLAASRYDSYLLLAYPAFALAAARLLVALPVRAPIAAVLVAGWIAVAGALHLVRDLRVFDGEDELRGLLRAAAGRAGRLYTFNLHAYAARFYLDTDVTTLLEREEDLRIAESLRAGGMPAPVELASNLPAKLDALPRPYLLLMPRARVELVRAQSLTALAETRHYVLYERR